jgi:hypothetical protein
MSPRGPYPTREVPRELIEQIAVKIDGTTYRAEADSANLLVPGGRVQPMGWARLEADTLTIRFGHRAADILDKLVPEAALRDGASSGTDRRQRRRAPARIRAR